MYDALNVMAKQDPRVGRAGSARNGVARPVIRRYLKGLGWDWTPTMFIGSGTKVHLCAEELPPGRLVVSCSKHLTAMIDGVIHDTHDPSRLGTRCVYGYWTPSRIRFIAGLTVIHEVRHDDVWPA